MQDHMDYDHNHEYQPYPFMKRNKKMSQGNQKITTSLISSGQYKPIYQASTAQNNEEDKGYYIDNPQF